MCVKFVGEPFSYNGLTTAGDAKNVTMARRARRDDDAKMTRTPRGGNENCSLPIHDAVNKHPQQKTLNEDYPTEKKHSTNSDNVARHGR